jgi:hypothetical protein
MARPNSMADTQSLQCKLRTTGLKRQGIETQSSRKIPKEQGGAALSGSKKPFAEESRTVKSVFSKFILLNKMEAQS